MKHTDSTRNLNISRKYIQPFLYLAIIIFLTISLIQNVHAKPKRTLELKGYTSLDYACSAIYYDVDKLLREYPNASGSRKGVILRKLSNLGKFWDNIGCRAVYGSVVQAVPTTPTKPEVKDIDPKYLPALDALGKHEADNPKPDTTKTHETPSLDLFEMKENVQ